MKENKENNIPKEMQEIWDLAGNYTYPAESSNEEAWELFESKANSKVRKLAWVKYAAAAVVLIFCGIFAVNTFTDKDQVGVETFTTNYGEFQTIELGDGTMVEIAPKSSLAVLDDYGKDTRTVELTGQAKFTVKRNEECPFIVKSSDLTTTVLGTVFEVRSDDFRTHQVVVHSGKVKVASLKEEVLLTKNQAASFANNSLTKTETFSFDNWNGVHKELVYQNATLSQIKEDLKALTGKSLEIPKGKLKERFTGKFENSGDVASICEVLSHAFGFEVTAI